jgi:hypothetical protein
MNDEKANITLIEFMVSRMGNRIVVELRL